MADLTKYETNRAYVDSAELELVRAQAVAYLQRFINRPM